MKCEKCSKKVVVTSKYQSGRFCSRACANSRQWSKKHNKQLSKKMKGYQFGGASLKPKLKFNCKLCGIEFETYPCHPNRKFCSRYCSQKGKNKKNTGGVRLGSGRSKSGYYNGIYCGSTYELAWVIYNLDHDIKFERNNVGFEYKFGGKVHKYYPDFVLSDGIFVEIKGYKTKQDAAKWKYFPHQLEVLEKDKLLHMFEYVRNTYGTYELKNLYEGNPYNEKLNDCLVCGEKCKNMYCCQKCSGVGVSMTKTRIPFSKEERLERARQSYNNNRDKVLARRKELYEMKKH